MRLTRRACWLLTIVASCLLTVGCGDGRIGAAGTVQVDGKPLEVGAISFKPAAGQNTHGAGATIRDGNFEIRADRGLFPGKYDVQIQAFRFTGKFVPDSQLGKIGEQVPMRFKEAGTLKAEIAANGANQFHFDLSTIPDDRK